ncbi:MAG: serine/threonine-protein kinase [Vicinamibacterales bacterium]
MAHHHDATIAPGETTRNAPVGFTPGEVVAGRYRMIGLLGRGGMGEVYRADDLTLGTSVALKFLPADTDRDQAALARFQAEVRIARQVSHPHVCRVFDIGTVGNRTFLTMEFVDGEDLATLLRRIGRLPAPKAVELGRQICAGLAAAHEQGVLHRDLKPANIMVDGHGRARITDFGLAVAGAATTAEFAGTPAYMAPELLAGHPASTRSDIYALGLVLYEMFTGDLPFRAVTLQQWHGAHSEIIPIPPSTRVGDIDPLVERMILACLEKDPARRPGSALALALSLPGGDPLAAAVAAGETPSPEMVAAAGGEGAASSRLAAVCLASTLAGLIALLLLTPYSTDLGLAPMMRSPDVLRDRAQEIADEFGYREPAVDSTDWMERDYDLLRWMADHLPSVDGRRQLRTIGPPVLFTYRRANVPLLPRDSGLITADSPAPSPGSADVRVVVDGSGRLREFAAPPHAATPTTDVPVSDALVFRRAGLDPARFTSVRANRVPPLAFDTRREWEGTRADAPALPIHVSAAWFENRIVWVHVTVPWSGASPLASTATRLPVVSFTFAAMLLLTLTVAGVFVYRNVRSGRGDRRGAAKLAGIAAFIDAVLYLTMTHTQPSVSAVANTLGDMLQRAAIGAGYIGVMYLAIEPFARRRVPNLLVGWARLLEGRWTDAGVARDFLIGISAGVVLSCSMHLANGLPSFVNLAKQTPVSGFSLVLYGSGLARIAPVPAVLSLVDNCLSTGLALFLLVVIARTYLSQRWALTVTALLAFTLLSGAENPWVEFPNALLSGFVLAWVVHTYGLLSFITLWSTYRLLVFGVSLGVVPTTWLAPYAWGTLATLATLSILAYRASLGTARTRRAETV